MKKRLNNRKVVICIFLIVLIISVPTLGRYIYNNFRDMYLKSQNFNFSSNLLDASKAKEYNYTWSGIGKLELKVQLYSYKNPEKLIVYPDGGLQYTIDCELNTDKAKCYLENGNVNETQNQLTGKISNDTNIDDVMIYIVPKEGLHVGDKFELKITAQTNSPYEKTISAIFKIEISEPKITYTIEDSKNSEYATLTLINTKDRKVQVKISYDSNTVFIDKMSDVYNNMNRQERTFEMEAEQSYNVKFYKKDISKDYSYFGEGTPVIEVNESN